MLEIKDGTGTGNRAKVNERKELTVRSRAVSGLHDESLLGGEAYWVGTTLIPVTTAAGYTGVLYVKNDNDTGDVIIAGWRLRLAGNVVQYWRLRVKAATGTLIDSGTDLTPSNVNVASARVLNANVKQGSNGQTVTDGKIVSEWVNNVGVENLDMEGALVLGPGDSLTLECFPQADGDVSAAVLVTQGIT